MTKDLPVNAGHTGSAVIELPRVTIMIPTYNQAGVILDAVDSVLAQDYPNLEIIVADDASTDNTQEVIATRRNPRLRYHRNPVNLGRVRNYRNTLYNLATGEWVVNLDGDDYFTDKEFVRAAVQLAARDSAVVVVMAKARAPDGGKAASNGGEKQSYIVAGHRLFSEIAFHRREFYHMATLYRREEALALDFYRQDTLSSDVESICRLVVQGKVAFLDRYVGVWRVNPFSASLTQGWAHMIESLEFWPSLFSEAVARGMPAGEVASVQRRVIGLMAYGHVSRLMDSGIFVPLFRVILTMAKRLGLGPALFFASRWRIYVRAIRCHFDKLIGRRFDVSIF
jgi:glycosyltransferase involved in cell wall biosynthesis